jgi:hypothetical protein
VPGRVLEATAYRLTQLSDEAREVLQAAAVAGNSFSAGVVAKMLDRSVLSLLGPLSECAAAGFLVAGDRPGDQRFSHALVSSAVVARLSTEEQRRLHTAAADAIEALYEGQVRLHLAEVARHRVEASLPGDRARAVAACEAAASVAWDALAFEEAVRLYRQALAAGGEEIGEADRDRLELALAAALHLSGDMPGAQQTAARVGRRAERRRDRLGLLAAVTGLRARVSARYAQALVYRGEYDRAGPVSRASSSSPRSRSSAWLRTCWPTRSSPSTRPASCTSAEPGAVPCPIPAVRACGGWDRAIMLRWRSRLGPSAATFRRADRCGSRSGFGPARRDPGWAASRPAPWWSGSAPRPWTAARRGPHWPRWPMLLAYAATR